MTTLTPAPAPAQRRGKAVAYAEDRLGVHTVYEDVVQHRNALDDLFTQIALQKDRRRTLEQQLQDREIDITSDEVGKHPGMSQAALDRHLKLEIPKDPEVRQIKSDLADTISQIEGLEYDIRVTETDVKIAVGRMTELGGYLQYLAAVKTAESAKSS